VRSQDLKNAHPGSPEASGLRAFMKREERLVIRIRLTPGLDSCTEDSTNASKLAVCRSQGIRTERVSERASISGHIAMSKE
jgi:hypothetical protein